MSEERKPVNQQAQQNQLNPQHHQNAHNHKSGSSSTGAALLQVVIISAIISLVIAGALFFALGSKSAKIAYIDTGKLLVGFSEADNVERAVKAEDDRWQVQLKILQDSLQSQIDRMSKEYDKATPVVKKELQDCTFLNTLS